MSLESKTITLNNQTKMPLLGLGVYKATGKNEVESAITHAVNAGYRMIDTASKYQNEDGVGRGIKASGIPRDQLFITTKIWNTAQRLGDIEGAFNRSLERLQLDYVDLYLIHWPVVGCYTNTWKSLETLYLSGRARAIGVSNFSIHDLETLKKVSDITPAVNQIEFHPLFNQSELAAYCQAHGIAVQAYAPLARGAYLDRDILKSLGNKYNKTTAQIGLRWSIQQNVSVIPKSTNKEHIISNGDIFDFTLTDSEMDMIAQMDEQYRSVGIPEDMQPYIT